VLDLSGQLAITRDNVKINISGILYYKVIDPYKASYGVNNPINAIS
jgi:regulator of protease activity HflC (stomatin/prohibitin superfamily)